MTTIKERMAFYKLEVAEAIRLQKIQDSARESFTEDSRKPFKNLTADASFVTVYALSVSVLLILCKICLGSWSGTSSYGWDLCLVFVGVMLC